MIKEVTDAEVAANSEKILEAIAAAPLNQRTKMYEGAFFERKPNGVLWIDMGGGPHAFDEAEYVETLSKTKTVAALLAQHQLPQDAARAHPISDERRDAILKVATDFASFDSKMFGKPANRAVADVLAEMVGRARALVDAAPHKFERGRSEAVLADYTAALVYYLDANYIQADKYL